MHDNSPSMPILLFYDGFERRAESTILGRAQSAVHRRARCAVRTLRRQQVLTGFGTWFAMLCRALESTGHTIKINDFAAARAHPQALVGAAGYPSVIEKLESLPNPRLLGPGLYTTPLEKLDLFDDPRNTLILLGCEWQAAMFKPFYGERVDQWFGGFDVESFPDTSVFEKTTDVLIYDKIYFDRGKWYAETIEPFIALLTRLGLTYDYVKYGDYTYSNYIKQVKKSRAMAFFAHSETQGMAYQECLSLNVPVFAWDEGVWANPVREQLGIGPIWCTSVPYFSSQCGLTFTSDNMVQQWSLFMKHLNTFQPRSYVADNLSLAASSDKYIRARKKAGLLAGSR